METLLLAARRGTGALEIVVLAVGSALAFSAVDLWYALGGRIAPVYLADAGVELVMVVLLVSVRRGLELRDCPP